MIELFRCKPLYFSLTKMFDSPFYYPRKKNLSGFHPLVPDIIHYELNPRDKNGPKIMQLCSMLLYTL